MAGRFSHGLCVVVLGRGSSSSSSKTFSFESGTAITIAERVG